MLTGALPPTSCLDEGVSGAEDVSSLRGRDVPSGWGSGEEGTRWGPTWSFEMIPLRDPLEGVDGQSWLTP